MKSEKNTIQATFFRRLQRDRAFRHAVLLALHARQTKDERELKTTIWSNAVGFNTLDAPVLSDLAEQVLAGKKLTLKQENEVVRRLKKYSRQFLRVTLAELTDMRRAA